MCDLPKSIIVEHVFGAQAEPLKIKVEKKSKGYGWEITCTGSDMAEVLSKIRAADAALKKEYGVA
jgi:hypothetical protein